MITDRTPELLAETDSLEHRFRRDQRSRND
jgi:hypothetical protein